MLELESLPVAKVAATADRHSNGTADVNLDSKTPEPSQEMADQKRCLRYQSRQVTQTSKLTLERLNLSAQLEILHSIFDEMINTRSCRATVGRLTRPTRNRSVTGPTGGTCGSQTVNIK